MMWGLAERGRDLRPLVGDLRQLASVRRIILDDGPERGVQALAFSTGGGLDFWVLCDRGFDIGPLWWKGAPLAWQSPSGFASPFLRDPDGDNGLGFERLFSGFMVTCGLEHIRQPANGKPLHGHLPFTPGRLLSHGEDWNASQPVIFCEGEITQARLNGERLRLKRRIEAPIGGATLKIIDEVHNIGGRDEPVALLYHMNFGFPIVGPGTTVLLNDEPLLGPLGDPASEAEPTVECFDVKGQPRATCTIRREPSGGRRGARAIISWNTSTLPYAQIWSDLRPYSQVIGIEPVTSARSKQRGNKNVPTLGPRQVLPLNLEVSFADL
jgi:hypothetical protein